MIKIKKIYNWKRWVFGLAMFFVVTALFGQKTEIKFTQMTIEDGLSHTLINSIDQDKEGFIWVSSHDGLNKFDGYQFKTYYNIPDNTNSLSDNIVTCFLQEENQMMWIGTHGGLNRMNPLNSEVKRFVHNRNDSTTLSNDVINSIVKDQYGFIWLGTEEGLNRLDPKNGVVDRIYKDTSNSGLDGDKIYKLYIDNRENLWVKTEKSILKMNLKTQKFQKIISLLRKENTVEGNFNFGMCQIESGDMLLGSYSGLYVYNYNSQSITKFINKPNEPNSLSDNRITSIIQDNLGVIWIGTYNGLNRFDEKTGDFYSYKHTIGNVNSLSNNIVTSIFQDKSGAIWLGTYGSGINRFNPFYKNFTFYKTPSTTSSIEDKNVWSVLEDRKKNLWWGTSNGLYVLNEVTNEIKYFGVSTEENKGLIQELVGALYQDSFGNLWIGTDDGISVLKASYVDNIFKTKNEIEFVQVHKNDRVLSFLENEEDNKMWVGVFDNGLLEFDMGAIYNPEKRIPKSLLKEVPGFAIDKINIAYILRDGNLLWLGSKNGLFKLNLEKQIIKQYQYQEGDENSVSHNKIYGIQKAKNGVLWLSAYGGGINKFNIETEEVKYYTTKDGLINNGAYNLVIDSQEKVWVSTNKGISKFDPLTETFKNYGADDGVQSQEFNQGAYSIGDSGRMYFGGIGGFDAFYPEEISFNKSLPKIALTDFFIFNKVVKPGKTFSELGISGKHEVVFSENINFVKEVSLSHEHSVFSIEFVSSHYLNPKKIMFSYKLEGFDNDWIDTNSSNRKITYTNLDPGEYVFKVKAANEDGEWSNEVKELRINISPPFWRTFWFYILCALVLFTLLYVVFKIRLNQIRLRHFKSQDELKTAMLKEIHHRVKNNLHIVKTLLRMQAASITDENIVAQFRKAQSRVVTMAILHEKMYKSESLKEISVQEHCEFLIRDLIDVYGIDKKVQLELGIEDVSFDMETLVPLGLIINELISNSLKYAFENRSDGIITVGLTQLTSAGQYELIVGDNGIGLPKEVNKLSDYMGSELVKTFVKQLKGTIELLDKPGAFFKIVFKKA